MTHVHLVGIGGSGLSAIARFMIQKGYSVSGSDLELSPLARELQESGATVSIGHSREHVSGTNFVIRSSAVPESNVEIQAALEAGIPVYKRSEYLGKLMEGFQVIAVAGSHGKTTTTAMISWMLTYLDQDPSYIIGGIANNLGTNAHYGSGSSFVIEADEYDRMFLGLQPDMAIVTNVEHDHPDCFPTNEDFFQAFVDFIEQIPETGLLLVNNDDPGAVKLKDEATKRNIKTHSFGLHIPGAIALDSEARNLEMDDLGNYRYDAHLGKTKHVQISLGIPGQHNVQNSLAALIVADQLELPLDSAAEAIERFSGTGRRFEVHGEFSGIAVIDDYAHHPTEIQKTLVAARNRYPNRQLWAVWQPHTYSRTLTLKDAYLSSFDVADHVLVTEVYASREPFNPDFSAEQVVDSMDHPDVCFLKTNSQVTDYLIENLNRGDVVIVLSAGDANQISEEVVRSLSRNGNTNSA